MTSRSRRSCMCCPAPATVCPECVRAIALQWFGAVARHPETGTDCRLCEHGHATYCASCFIAQVTDRRAALRQAGTFAGRAGAGAVRPDSEGREGRLDGHPPGCPLPPSGRRGPHRGSGRRATLCAWLRTSRWLAI
jgi:hypothetical protein